MALVRAGGTIEEIFGDVMNKPRLEIINGGCGVLGWSEILRAVLTYMGLAGAVAFHAHIQWQCDMTCAGESWLSVSATLLQLRGWAPDMLIIHVSWGIFADRPMDSIVIVDMYRSECFIGFWYILSASMSSACFLFRILAYVITLEVQQRREDDLQC